MIVMIIQGTPEEISELIGPDTFADIHKIPMPKKEVTVNNVKTEVHSYEVKKFNPDIYSATLILFGKQ